MKRNKTIGDILKVSLSNIALLLSGVLVGFLLPKIIGVTGYGYYKTYTLYATYVGMFHFGISDGIYLKYGGENYDNLDRSKFRFYSKTIFLIELLLSLILAIISITTFRGEYHFIFLFLSLYLLFHNVTSYYQVISQSTSRFKELSTRNIIQSACISMLVILLWAINRFTSLSITYRSYIIFYSCIVISLAAWYTYTYRDITFGRIKENDKSWRDLTGFVFTGFPLMLANLCSSLILTLDRQFVNILFDNDTYAIYAFAYNMLSLVTTATSAISTVIYPKLKQMSLEHMRQQYTSLVSVMLCLVYGCLIVYFPLNMFVNWFLPKYSLSLPIFRVIFPGLGISSAITIVMHNYYKAMGETNLYFVKSIVTLIVSGIANTIAYHMFHTTISISIASIITMIFWYFFAEHTFVKRFHAMWIKNFSYLIFMMTVFYLITAIPNQYIGFAVYLLAYGILTFTMFSNIIKTFFMPIT